MREIKLTNYRAQTKKKKSEKGKEHCFQCDEIMTKVFDTLPGSTPGSVRVIYFMRCPRCKYQEKIQ